MTKTLIYPPGHPAPRGAYSPGLLIEHGGVKTLYITGQLAVDAAGAVVAPDDTGAQTQFVFGLIGAILREVGMDFADVVKVDTFLTHMADFPKFSAVRNGYFEATKPVSTLLEVKGLAREGCRVEIEVLAVK